MAVVGGGKEIPEGGEQFLGKGSEIGEAGEKKFEANEERALFDAGRTNKNEFLERLRMMGGKND